MNKHGTFDQFISSIFCQEMTKTYRHVEITVIMQNLKKITSEHINPTVIYLV